MITKIEFLRKQVERVVDLIEQIKGLNQDYVPVQSNLMLRKMEIEEKIFDIEVRQQFKKNKTLQDAYDNFNDLYKIETGNDYE